MFDLILGISGSPTRGGSNEQAVEYALSIARERGYKTERVLLSEAFVEPCSACGTCRDGDCPKDDDMQKAYELMRRARGIFISSPVYMGCMTAQLKALFDRSVLLRRHGFELKNIVGAATAIGASRNGGQELVLGQIQAAMHIHGMIVVGDDSHFGGIVQAPFEEDEEGRKTVQATINKLCDVLGLIG